jgi:N-acetylmuramoyl-L-alanine amidase
MGWAERDNHNRPLPYILKTRLEGLRVAVDVQHLYKTDAPQDRGAIFELPGGFRVAEAQAATTYAQACVAWLSARGATVLTNHLARLELIGSYYRRLKQAEKWGARAYLACHINAGRGSYAALEYPQGAAGIALSTRIGLSLTDGIKEILSYKSVPLGPKDRGFACIGSFPTDRAAVLVEPFFGDNPRQQGLLSTPRLVELGEAIGEGVARWWEAEKDRRLI